MKLVEMTNNTSGGITHVPVHSVGTMISRGWKVVEKVPVKKVKLTKLNIKEDKDNGKS